MARLKALIKVRNPEGIREDYVVDNFSDVITKKVKFLKDKGYTEIIVVNDGDPRRRR